MSKVIRRYGIIVAALVFISPDIKGQKVVFSMTGENDYFTGTDRYFTNGLHLELQFDNTNSPLLRQILPTFPEFKTIYYGVGITQNIYTPGDLNTSKFLPHDLPYSGTFFASLYRVSVNSKNTLRLTSEFDGGVMGPQAEAGEVQTWFHRLIHDKLPQGWRNQVNSDLIINHKFGLTKTIIQNNYAAVLTDAKLNIGTVMNTVGSGVIVKLGVLSPAMQDLFHHEKKITANLFFGAGYTYVAGNRLLGARQELNLVPITHDVYSYQYGAEVSGRSFKISYTVSAISKQRDDIQGHRYGSIMLAFRII